MNHQRAITSAIIALLLLGTRILANEGFAQQKSLRDQLLGSWTLVSTMNTRPDGSKFDPNGGQPTSGLFVLDGSNHFSWQIIRTDIPKLASNNRGEGTADEFKAVAQGVLSYFGTYSLDDSGKTLAMSIETSSFPNFNGAKQNRSITLTGDELTVTNPAGASGGTAEVKWKRVR
jgi:hypothetical protein